MRTVQACELVRLLAIVSVFGTSVPSGRRQPGNIDCGMGSGSVNGSRINGLVGNASIVPQPFSALAISIGVWSVKPLHCWAHELLPTSDAPPAINPSFIKSRLVG